MAVEDAQGSEVACRMVYGLCVYGLFFCYGREDELLSAKGYFRIPDVRVWDQLTSQAIISHRNELSLP